MIYKYKGIKINYEVSGKGSPLVFLHGFLENSIMWTDIVPFFEKDYTCITIDLLGHGKTDSLGYIHTMENMAIAVRSVLDSLRLQNYQIIGHSMGGYVALAMLDLFPKNIKGIALLNSTAYPDNQERQQNRDRAIAIVKKNPEAYTTIAVSNLFSEKNRLKYASDIEKVKAEASKTSIQGMISALEGMKIRKNRTKVLENFSGVKIIFAGKKDPVLPYNASVKESNLLGIDLISFEGGHMTHIEDCKELIESLRHYVTK